MGVNLDQALGLHPAALKLRAERARVLASNLANENTPGYQARDIDFRASLRHQMRSEQASLTAQPLLYRLPNHPSTDGNTVELGVEQAEFSQNASDFQMTLTFLNMQIKGLTAAINGGN